MQHQRVQRSTIRVLQQRPEPHEHPGFVVVGDYLFDSTLNGVLDSAEAACDVIVTDVLARLWRWRPLLRRCTLVDFIAGARLRLIGRILSPTPLIKLVRLARPRHSVNASAHSY